MAPPELRCEGCGRKTKVAMVVDPFIGKTYGLCKTCLTKAKNHKT